MKSVFVGFNDGDDVFSQFNVGEEEQMDVEFLYAFYECEYYEGAAFVLFARKGKLYEAHGSHCSCYGLEDQWSPEETSLEALEKRGYYWANYDFDEVKKAIKRWKQREYARKRRTGK